MRFLDRSGLRLLRRSVTAGRKPAVALLALAVSATVVASPPPKRDSLRPVTRTPQTHRWYQIGKATWYGRAFQGKRTATGERFDMNALTCAHRTLPLGSWLRVTNLHNRRSTLVRVNDRGPYNGDTIVDVSYAAAQRLGLLGKAQVRVEEVRPDDPEVTRAEIAQLNNGEQVASAQ